MKALISEGECFLPRVSTQASPLSPLTILYGTRSMSRLTSGSSKRRPTRRSPLSVNATIEGVVRAPSAFSMTLAALPSMTATQEFVVPRSMPITLAILLLPPDGGRLRPSLKRLEANPLESIGKSGAKQYPYRRHGVYRKGPLGAQ